MEKFIEPDRGLDRRSIQPVALKNPRKWRPNKNLIGYLFIAPAMLFLIFMTIYPLFRVIQLSFLDYSVQKQTGDFIGLQNYIRLLSDDLFITSLKNTAIFAIARAVIHIPMGLGLALLINAKWPSNLLRGIFRGLLIVPWLFSNAVAALIWTLIFHPFGIMNTFLQALHLIERPISLLGNPDTALPALIVVILWKTYPFTMIMLLGALQAIPEELHDAAQVDGANIWQRIRFITVPLIMPVLLTTVTLELIWGFNQFDIIKLMTGGGPLRATEVISFRVYDTAFFSLDFGYGSAMSVVTFLILMVFVWFYVRFYTRGQFSNGN